jgi:hypothetical protein
MGKKRIIGRWSMGLEKNLNVPLSRTCGIIKFRKVEREGVWPVRGIGNCWSKRHDKGEVNRKMMMKREQNKLFGEKLPLTASG